MHFKCFFLEYKLWELKSFNSNVLFYEVLDIFYVYSDKKILNEYFKRIKNLIVMNVFDFIKRNSTNSAKVMKNKIVVKITLSNLL